MRWMTTRDTRKRARMMSSRHDSMSQGQGGERILAEEGRDEAAHRGWSESGQTRRPASAARGGQQSAIRAVTVVSGGEWRVWCLMIVGLEPEHSNAQKGRKRNDTRCDEPTWARGCRARRAMLALPPVSNPAPHVAHEGRRENTQAQAQAHAHPHSHHHRPRTITAQLGPGEGGRTEACAGAGRQQAGKVCRVSRSVEMEVGGGEQS